jgi:hypothetical protein
MITEGGPILIPILFLFFFFILFLPIFATFFFFFFFWTQNIVAHQNAKILVVRTDALAIQETLPLGIQRVIFAFV